MKIPVSQAAEALGVSSESIRRYLKQGQLRGFQLPGGTWRVDSESVDELIANGEPEPGVIDPTERETRLTVVEGSLRARATA